MQEPLRHLIILPQLFCVLNLYKQESGYLIRRKREKEDEPITRQGIKRLYDRIEYAVKESGIAFGFKLINRRGATFMNNMTLDDKIIEGQLGHKNARFTRERYMNAQAKQEERSMDKLASYLTAL